MPKEPLSKPDYTQAHDMRYMRQLRGLSTAWVFKMQTPPDLVGFPNPWGGSPFSKEISRGLGTHHPVEACKRRDLALGDIRSRQYKMSDAETFSLSSAMQWRNHSAAINRANDDPKEAEAVELIPSDKLQVPMRAVYPCPRSNGYK